MMGGYLVLTLIVFLVDGLVADTSGLNLLSVMEGHNVTLSTGVTKQQRDKMLWYFNNTLIALINGDPSKSCLYYGEGGRFRDRLKVDYETGSLIITDITTQHAGRYEANFIQSKSTGTSQSLNRNSKCDGTKITRKMSNIGENIKTLSVSVTAFLSRTDKPNVVSYNRDKEQEHESSLSLGLIAGICVGVLLLATAAVLGVINYRCRRSSKENVEKNKSEQLLKVPL
ncbi:uncharacterized protein LOC127987116 [Carassius gibelio]|uniref:uncharacterized protein LOC127987116 n=1 Tax=Carassius gibelio TaxID=101364 RepID=UPI0022799712|nr:uncharacterized protein LOC127987116 [Carassius gibelio]